MNRIKGAVKNLEPLIDEATDLKIQRGQGRKPDLELKQRVMILLLKGLFGKSNKMMASILSLFSLLFGIDVSYKTIERLYSDQKVEMAIHNLHILILKKKGVNDVNGCGDGTGYSLTIRKHYASETIKRKDKAKESMTKLGKAFVYSFKMLDLESKMYIAYGTSLKERIPPI